MRPLIGKLDMLLLAPPRGCSSKNVMDGMRLLRDDVEKISSYLDDLSELTDPPLRAKCWMNEVRDLSYDMEDYIDGLIFVQPGDPSLVPSNIKTTRSLHKMSSHVKASKTQVIIAAMLSEFRMYVQETIERHQRYNLHSCSTLRHRFASLGPMLLPTTYEETEDIVIDGRMNEFINSVANDRDQQLKVVCVLGSTCLGKTTLVKVLYNKFGKNYSCRAFIRVSKKPDMRRVFHDMLLQLQRKDPSRDCKEVDLIDRINEYLQDKRYLIIIDDVWATSVWDIINHAFPKGNHGSRIITTTQVEDVALTCCCYQSEYLFEMKHLDDDHSRKLFFNRVFGSQSDCPEQLKEILNEIVEVCDGLPFAIINIASLLTSQPTLSINLLKYIHRSLSSCFSASERMRQALNLSFNNLPHYLKTCLLYLIMYPEGYIFCNDDLVKAWVAEGFIDTMEGQDGLKVAERYLDQLIWRRLIHPICINYNNEVLSCAIHDTVYDLIASKSAEENFIVAIDYSQKNMLLSNKVRRLSLLFGDARYAKTPINIRKSQVRSLAYFGLFDCMPCIREFKFLRVLNLQLSFHGDSYNPVDLTGISELIQLRYLKIGCDICIKLPTDGLKCLETLDITDAVVISSSRDIILPQLLHLKLPFARSLLYWNGTKWILGGAGGLNSLEDLHLTGSSTDSYDLERNIKSLGYLIQGHKNLRTVVMAHSSKIRSTVVPEITKVIISKPSKEVISSGASLLQRFECSQASGITFSKIPKWVKELDNLVILKIAVKELHMICVDILKELHALAALSLYVRSQGTKKIIFDKAGFSALRYFKLRFTTGVAWIKFEKDAMPSLWKLKLIFNAVPQMIPKPYFHWTHSDRYELYKQGDALISIDHMPVLGEISAKFGGSAADVEYIKSNRIGISNDRSNPEINMQWVEDQSRKQKEHMIEIMEIDFADETLDGAAADVEYIKSKRIGISNDPNNPDINMQWVDHQSTEQKEQTNEVLEIGFADETLDGAAADVEYIKSKRIGISNDPNNPDINMQWVDHQSTEQKEQTDEVLEIGFADETLDGAAADVEYIKSKRIGISNDPNNPDINMQWVDHQSTEQKEQTDEILEIGFADETLDGAAADVEYIKSKRIGISNDPNNPDMNMQWVDHQSTEQKEQTDEILEIGFADETLNGAAAGSSQVSLHEFTLDELISATSNFSEAHFNGDHYEKRNLYKTFCRPGVYKGSFENKEVAVKCLKDFSEEGEWPVVDERELECIAMVCHPHLVKLLGFCDYKNQRMLVYADMPRENLKDYIFNGDTGGSSSTKRQQEQLPWLTRLKIAIGAAKGLAFLHQADKPMVHGDFKTSNILLGSDRKPKLFGFRLAKDNLGAKTAEGDVYNFGVVLLELLAGRPAIELPGYFYHTEDATIRIMDESFKGKYSLSAACSTVKIAGRCLKSVPKERPSMQDVVQALEPLLKLGADDGIPKEQPSMQGISSSYPASWGGRHEFKRSELMSATSNFSGENLLGKADYGHIYEGAVGKFLVAVMKLHPDYNRHRHELEGGLLWHIEWMRHPHMLSLLGYCNQDEHDILVYEHMPREGRLLQHILETHHIGSIPWLSRLKIAVGVAKALAYLEDKRKIYAFLEDERRIYYSGFKASCIMVDWDHTAKLFGFHLVKENPQDKTMESNVYNFGVVLLQLLAGRPSIDEKLQGRKKNLVTWSSSYLNENKLRRIMDPRLLGEYSFSAACCTAIIARRCLQDEERPSMREVVHDLEPLLSDGRNDGRHSRAVRWTPSLLLGRSGAVKGRGKAKQGKEVEEPTTGASSVTLPGTLNS